MKAPTGAILFSKSQRNRVSEELAEAFDVSRITVKRAVNELAAEDLVELVWGVRTN